MSWKPIEVKFEPETDPRKLQTIELDCPPGNPRPGDLIGDVIKGTGLPERPPTYSFMGEWSWDYSDIAPEVWAAAKPTLAKRIDKLYKRGVIRYGAW